MKKRVVSQVTAWLVTMVTSVFFGVSAQTQIINPHGLIDEDVEWDLGDYNYCRWGVLQDANPSITQEALPFNYIWRFTHSLLLNESDLFFNSGTDVYNVVDADGRDGYNNGLVTLNGNLTQNEVLFSEFHFPERLNDLMTTGFVDENVENLVILVHGWNLSGTPFQYGGAFETLWRNLTEALEGTSWGLSRYQWSKDSATGSPLKGGNPSDERVDDNRPDSFFVASAESAAIGDSHGRNLSEILHTQHPNLKRVILMCHSAGTWVGYRTAKSLLMHNDTVEVELMLMDPYIPGEVVGGTPLTADRIRSLDGFGGDRITLHNYNSEDNALATFACIGDDPAGGLATTVAFGTSVHFGWSARHIEAAVHSRYHPEHFNLCEYGGHEGPILFVADTVASYLGRPSERWSSEWNDKYGFGNSLFTKWKLHEEIPVVSIEDELPWQTHERVAREWQELGFADVTADDVNGYGISKYDWYEIRSGQLTALMMDENREYTLTRGLGLYLPGFEPNQQTQPGGPGVAYTYQGGNRYDLLPPTHAQLVGTICVPGHSGFDIGSGPVSIYKPNEDGQQGLDLKQIETGEQIDTFTIEGWIKMLPLNNVLADCVIMQKAVMNGSQITGWELSLSDGGRHLQFRCGDSLPTIVVAGKKVYRQGETVHRAMNIITEDDINRWTHLAITVSLSGKTAQVYKNGVEQMVETPVCDVTTIHPTGGIQTTGQPFVFGSSSFGDGNPREIHGSLRDWSVWGYERPIDVIKDSDWIVGLEGHLIAHWRFTQSYGFQGTIHDAGRYTNHLRFQWPTGPDPGIQDTSYTHEGWKGIRTAVFAEGDRLPDVVVAGGDAVNTATLPNPAYHFAMDGTELLGAKLRDGVTSTELRVDGLLSGASGYDGNSAGAYHFNNQNASSQSGQTFLWLQPEDQLRFNHESFAIGLWVRVDPSWKTGTRTPLMIGRHVQLRIDLSEGVPHITNGNLHVAGNSDIADGEWHHLMGVMTYENWEDEALRRGTLSLYVDATWIGSDDNPNYGSIIAGSNLELTIGAHPAPRELFQGDIDDVIIWQNTDITREQIVTYYESSGRTAPEVAADGPVFVATEANEHSFAIVQQENATYTDGALVLNRGYARLSGLSLSPGTGPFTIRGVFNTTSGSDHALVSMNGSGGFLLQVKPSRIVVTLHGPNIYAHIDSGFNFADGEDHTFSMSFDNDRAERIILTVDGVASSLGGSTTEQYNLPDTYEWLLGAAIGNGVVGGQFTGTIKNISITTP